MEEYDLLNDLAQKKIDLNKSIRNLRKSSQDYAEAFTNYRIALAKELLRLKTEGYPVTSAYDIARGNEEIAKLKFDEICKEGIYKANQESIQALKLELKLLEAQIEREWGQAKDE